ncbi:hypothetical protein MLD38_034137 [Melastoma candidum]|uniref:Uncharacterized protein n=1 Tax=Melastoma candidum TaxID=119954 RepID=A0ACB9M8R9_9MYRT|nr:hypothetical protein MLD38_034137 [Melastoma candidum]
MERTNSKNKDKRQRNHNPQPFLSDDHDSTLSSKNRCRGLKNHQEDQKLISSVITSKILKQALIQQKEIQDEDDDLHRRDSGLNLGFPDDLGSKLRADADDQDDDDVDDFHGFDETQSQFGNHEFRFFVTVINSCICLSK